MSNLRKALDNLEKICPYFPGDQELLDESIKALRTALAQQEQEPVAWRYRTVTFWNSRPQTRYLESLEGAEGLLGIEPLYTAPPKREWVGLTDEDRREFAAAQYGWEDLLAAADAKLKEKNT
jgi:hypothetical protein